jgi:toxin ParE1/3/4
MAIIIEWSELSAKHLQNIYNYYLAEAGNRVADKIINEIITRVDILYQNPFAGAKEELLAEYPEEFRYLVAGNYKVIYWIEKNIITVASVFDCRQNPVKMKKMRNDD